MTLKDTLSFPTTTTYYICWNDLRTEIQNYGDIQTNQSFKTKFSEVDLYTDKNKWDAILIKKGINTNPVEIV